MTNIYPDSLSKIAGELILTSKRRGFGIATAESCTGGLIAGLLTSISGSSAVFEYGFITYSNNSKTKILGVLPGDIDKFGAVSETVVCQMAEGAINNSSAHLTVAVTGVAGPDGGTHEKPVGTVFIASACVEQKTLYERFLFEGDREKVRLDTVQAALNLMLRQLNE